MNYNPDARPSNPSANEDSSEYTLRDGSRIVFPLNLDEPASDDSDGEDSPYYEYSTNEESYGRRGRQMGRNGQYRNQYYGEPQYNFDGNKISSVDDEEEEDDNS